MDIKEILASDEGKAAIALAVEEATKGLKSKNEELLGKLNANKEKLAEKEAKEQELEAARAQAEEEAAMKSGDANKIKETYEAKLAALTEQYKTEKADLLGKLDTVVIDNGLTDALTQHNIAPQHIKAVKALIKSENNLEIGEFEGKASAVVDGKPLTQFIAEWSQGEIGKHYVAAPDNGGGGANGANGGGQASGGKGNMGGSKEERLAAINSKFPELQKGN